MVNNSVLNRRKKLNIKMREGYNRINQREMMREEVRRCNPTPQGYWIEDSKRIGLEWLKKALRF